MSIKSSLLIIIYFLIHTFSSAYTFNKSCFFFVIKDHNLTFEYIFSDDRSYDFLFRIRILLKLDEIFCFLFLPKKKLYLKIVSFFDRQEL